MSAPPLLEKRTVHPPTDGGFRHAVVFSTCLLFAAAFGWLACIQRMKDGSVEFHWQGSAWLWLAIGVVGPVYFWRQIWPTRIMPPVGATRRLVTGWAAILIPSLMWMTYPLRFISGQQLANVTIGLAIAGTVLALGGWMVFRLIKGFAHEETTDARVAAPGQTDAKGTAGKPPASPPPPKNLGWGA